MTTRRKPKILIVDDESTNIQALYGALRGEATVLFATNDEQALALAERDRPDLVLLDVMMPGMDGFEVCTRLKAQAETRDCMVVFVSAADDDAEIERGLALGADDYLVKPVTAALARRRVHLLIELKALRSSRKGQTPATAGARPRTGPQRVLVVEDGEINRMVLWQMLDADGHAVSMALSAEEGLTLALNQPFDAVLMDIHLPGMSGIEAVKRLRAAETKAGLPPHRVIAVTGDAPSGSLAQFEAVGFDVVVRKPIDPADLRAALQGLPPPGTEDGEDLETRIDPDLLINHTRMIILRRTYSPERQLSLFRLFERKVRAYVASLRRALDGQDLREVAAVAHRLKSALGHFACDRMAQISDRLAHTASPLIADVERDVANLERLLPDTLIALRGALDVAPDDADSGDGPGA